MDKQTLIIVVNEDRFFLSHRKDIGVAAQKKGWDVIIVAKDTGRRSEVEDLGLTFINLPINPTGKNVVQELKVLRFLRKLYKEHPDALVHHVGLKLLLWGTLSASSTHVRGVVNAVSGLGTLFAGGKRSKLAKVVFPLLRRCGRKFANIHYIFQNSHDRNVFASERILNKFNHHYIKGSGVNLSDFEYAPLPEELPLKVVFTGRMLKEKGVLDVIEVAKKLRPKYEDSVEFILCGALSSNPSALSQKEIEKLIDGKYIQWRNHLQDVRPVLRESTVFLFPSLYGEGIPKSVIEASAVGRPILTYDSVGCRDTVKQGRNGFAVPVRDCDKLAEKLDYLLSNRDVCEKMGEASRELAEKHYDIRTVVRKHLEIYDIVSKKGKKL